MDAVLRHDWSNDLLPILIAGHINRTAERNDITATKVQARAANLHLRRSDGFGRLLRQRGISGRPKGRRNNATLARIAALVELKKARHARKPERNARIVDLFREGVAASALAQQFSLNRTGIYQIADKAGLRRDHIRTGEFTTRLKASRARGKAAHEERTAFYASIMPEVIRLREQRWDWQFIARKFGRCWQTIELRVRKIRPDLCGQKNRAMNVYVREHGYARERVRTNFTAHWTADASDEDVFRSAIAQVLRCLPAHLHEEAKDEAIQVASIMLLENPELGKDPKALCSAAMKNYGREYGQWGTVSLDAPFAGHEDLSHMDFLAAPEPEMDVEDFLDARREEELAQGRKWR